MSLESLNPFYSPYHKLWSTMRHLYQGESAVKDNEYRYLPPTQSMILDGLKEGEDGREAYKRYLQRAVFHEFVRWTVENYIGILWEKPHVIELPKAMEFLIKRSTVYSEGIMQLYQRIHREILITGRVGLMIDINTRFGLDSRPHIALYAAESIQNWDDFEYGEGLTQLNLVVLDESTFIRREDFEWEYLRKKRALKLQNEVYQQAVIDNLTGNFETNETDYFTPKLKGVTLDKLPFIFINTKDCLATPTEPPLMPLATYVLALYRGEADYRQTLHNLGQETLVLIGDRKIPSGQNGPVRIGANSLIEMELTGDAKFVGINGKGLTEQRMAIEADKGTCERLAGMLLDKKQVESVDAMGLKVENAVSTLYQISMNAAKGLENILKIMAEWMDINPDEVRITPNLDFNSGRVKADDLKALMEAKMMGLPLSNESIHMYLRKQKITGFSYDEEKMKIESEADDIMGEVKNGQERTNI